MNRIVLAIAVLALASLACGQYVPTVTPTPSPVPPTAAATATPEPTRTAAPTATDGGEVVQTAVVRQPSVNVRDAAGGDPTGEYVYAGQEVTVLETVTLADGGEWARIAEPSGWLWAGCLEGSEKGCEAE